jgi:D-sedoheptulose 7-phosphate isomerase
VALTADSTLLTLAIVGGDDGAQQFARQVRALGQAGDVLLALSVTGNDANVLAATEAAHERDMTVVIAVAGAPVARWPARCARPMC